MEFDRIRSAIRETGLMARGGFHPAPDDAVPLLPDGRTVATLVLLGNAGNAMWRAFRDRDAMQDHRHPLEKWSQQVITGLATRLGAHPLFPFSRSPFLPFQRWAQRAEPVWPSPIGVLIHPEYGSWHAYRGALAFPVRVELPPRESLSSPCDTCAEQPCLSACPVDAFAESRYDVPACVEHLGSPEGENCLERGCLARRACPVGREFLYPPGQAEFHMRAFLRAFQRRSGESR
jgi:hypothetical protein